MQILADKTLKLPEIDQTTLKAAETSFRRFSTFKYFGSVICGTGESDGPASADRQSKRAPNSHVRTPKIKKSDNGNKNRNW